jgi:hypothetical protein
MIGSAPKQGAASGLPAKEVMVSNIAVSGLNPNHVLLNLHLIF